MRNVLKAPFSRNILFSYCFLHFSLKFLSIGRAAHITPCCTNPSVYLSSSLRQTQDITNFIFSNLRNLGRKMKFFPNAVNLMDFQPSRVFAVLDSKGLLTFNFENKVFGGLRNSLYDYEVETRVMS